MILFLDFDGVMHPRGKNSDVDCLFQSAPVLWVLLAQNPDLDVVLSTSWRTDYPFDVLQEFCTYEGGEQYINRIVGANPKVNFDKRGLECRLWMDNNRPCDAWLAVDDDASLYDSGCDTYIVNPETGLTMSDVGPIQSLIDSLRNPNSTPACYNS